MGFSKAVEFVIGEEGGFTDDPRDRGGATKFGISQRAYPGLNIAKLTRDDAIHIYQRDYWDRLPSLPSPIDFLAFDFAVNAGIGRAVKCLQLAIGVKDDGNFGPVSHTKINKMAPIDVAILYQAERARHYAQIDDGQTFIRGWMRRTMRAFAAALQEA